MMEKGKIEYVKDPEVIPPDLPAVDNKVYRNKINGTIIYGPVYLGKIFFKDGKKLKNPIQEKPEDFELVDRTEV